MPKKVTTEEFTLRSKLQHNGKYSYDRTIYTRACDSIIITCPFHGEFKQIASNHVKGLGCRKCSKNNYPVDTQVFISRGKEKHKDFYDYSKVEYTNNSSKVIITCPDHGDFLQTPASHTILGNGCNKCAKLYPPTTKEWIKRAHRIFDNYYDYSKTEYVNARTKVTIICPTHGEFSKSPNDHINGHQGCRQCNHSKGERQIRLFLKKKKIDFIIEKRFHDCKNKRSLPFDFFLPSMNLLIEYDGKQHFEPVQFKNMTKEQAYNQFLSTKTNDSIKTNYAQRQDIKLLRISYKQYQIIDSILEENI